MFYKFSKDGLLEGSSNVKIDDNYLELEFSTEEIKKLNKGYLYLKWEFLESDLSIFNEKQIVINILKELSKKWEELRSKYLSAELLPDSELKTEKLRILKENGDLIMWEYLQKEADAITKYGIEILQEIL